MDRRPAAARPRGPALAVPALALAALLLAAAPARAAEPDGWTEPKRTAARWVDEEGARLDAAALRLWELAELALREQDSSRLLRAMLTDAGFTVRAGVSGMDTAFIAEAGSGRPVVGILAEYDALPGLSQTVSGEREARVPGAGGHGCGHNLFGAGSVGAALATAAAMEAHGLPGTVRLYGTPAEEQGLGKIYMVRDGLLDDLELCLAWHPADETQLTVNPSKALRSFEVTFHGRSAHAAAAPWNGVSALDAIEAFGAGVNLLREHVPLTARIHYVVTEGGDAPNVIPSRARLWAFVRGRDWPECQQVYEHVEAIVRAADMMAWGEEHGDPSTGYRPAEITRLCGLYDLNVNLTASRACQANLELVGPPAFTADEQALAREIQEGFGLEPAGMATEIVPFDPERPPESGGSTDVGNVSWVTPTLELEMATWPVECPAHSWASTAASGAHAGLRAMRTAAKVLAMTAVDALTDAELRARIRAEFEASREGFDYSPAVGEDDVPTLPSHMRDSR